MDAGTDPADPQVQQLTARWEQLRAVFLDDDTAMEAAAGHAWQAMWEQHPEQLRDSPRVAPPEMGAYIARARDVAGRGH